MTSVYMERKTPRSGGTPVVEPQRRKVASNAIEEMAEGVLNGMFCHYEPPDPSRYQPQQQQQQSTRPLQQRGILRQTSIGKNKGNRPQSTTRKQKNPSSGNRVRWEDEHTTDPQQQASSSNINNTTTTTEQEDPTGCSITQTCLDASIEVGCGGGGGRKKTKMMDAEEAIAVAKAKSPRANGQQPDLIMDEHGNIQYADGKQHPVPPPPPPPPPPPSKNERYFPQLCGMRINCGGGGNGDDPPELLQTLMSTSQSFDYEKHLLQQQQQQQPPGTNGSYDDQDNSILESSSLNSNGSLLQHQKSLATRPPDNIHAPSIMMNPNNKQGKVAPKKKQGNASPHGDLSDDDDDDDDRRSSSSGSSTDDERSPKPSRVASATSSFFRRVFPRSSNGNTSHQKHANRKTDEQQPIVISSSDSDSIAVSSRGRSRYRSRSASPARPGSKTPEQSSSKERKGALNNKNIHKDAKANNSNKNKMNNNAKSTPTTKLTNSSNDDWDTSIPIVPSSPAAGITNTTAATMGGPPPRGRERGPALEVVGTVTTSRRRNRSRSEERPSSNHNSNNMMVRKNISRSRSPARRRTVDGIPSARNSIGGPMNSAPTYLPLQQQRPGAPPQNPQQVQLNQPSPFHGATPHRQITQPGAATAAATVMNRVDDDAAERESFITAYRQGFDESIVNGGGGVMDDAMERQSFITAYRQGADGSIIHGGENNYLLDDMMERQSFITAHRQGFGGPVNSNINNVRNNAGGDGGVTRDRQSFLAVNRQMFDPSSLQPPPPQRPTGRPMTHEEMMRRHQFITAQRQGMKLPNQPSFPTGRANFPQPLPRSHSFEHDRKNAMVQDGQFLPLQNIQPGRLIMNGSPSYPMTHGNDRVFQGGGREPIQPSYNVEEGRVMPPPATSFDPRMGEFVPSQSTIPYGGSPYTTRQMQPQQPYGQVNYNNINVPVDPSVGGMYYVEPYPNAQPPVRTQPLQVFQPVVAGPTKLPESKPPEEKKEEDMTWEERTRRAWERIRGGVESAFSLDYASKDEKKETTDKDIEKDAAQLSQKDSQQSKEEYNSNSIGIVGLANNDHRQQQQQFHQQQQQLLFQQEEQQRQQMFMGGRRVTFGPPEERVFYDEQDENRSMMPYHDNNRIVKKKMKFRGTKLLKGMFAKKKKNSDNMYPSMSMDSSIYPSYSNEWGLHPGATDDSSLYYGSSSMSYDYDSHPQGMAYQTVPNAAPQAAPYNSFYGGPGQFQSPQRIPMGPRPQN